MFIFIIHVCHMISEKPVLFGRSKYITAAEMYCLLIMNRYLFRNDFVFFYLIM